MTGNSLGFDLRYKLFLRGKGHRTIRFYGVLCGLGLSDYRNRVLQTFRTSSRCLVYEERKEICESA
jgi:hypothetical protein